MSLQSTVYAMDMPDVGENGERITPLDLLVMLVLSDCYDHQYPTPFPRLEWLADCTRMETEELIGVLRGLEAKGMLSVLRKVRGDDPYTGHEYAFPGMGQRAVKA